MSFTGGLHATPVSAKFETQFGDFPDRFGIAYLIDSEWRFARAVVVVNQRSRRSR